MAVARHEQNAVAGMVTSVNGLAYVAAPAVGVLIYGFGWSLPFVLVGVVMVGTAMWASFSRSPSRPDAA